MASSKFFDLLPLLVVCGSELLGVVVACDESYQCRFGQQCCKETNTCQASCSRHETNVGVIIGIVAAVALGNVLFWVTFCCLCWCKGSRKSSFRYRSFGDENDDNRQTNNDDDAIDDDMITKDTIIDNGCVITDDGIDDNIDERSKVLGMKDGSRKEEISLSIIKIKRPILKVKKTVNRLGESSSNI